MSTFLAYTPAADGHVHPLVRGLLELQARGHRVVLLTGPDQVPVVRAAGLEAEPIDPAILDVVVDDHSGTTSAERFRGGLGGLLDRGELEMLDLERAISRIQPDVVLADVNTYGATVAAAASGLPWAMTLPSLLPWKEPGIPPYGLGLAPKSGVLGRIRDAVLWRAVIGAFGRTMMPRLNALRAQRGLEPFTNPLQRMSEPDRLLVLTGEPLEYPRQNPPANAVLTGPQLWEPPVEAPDWLDAPGDPWVLVTCSTDYQGDERLAAAAVQALAGQPYRVCVTLGQAYDTFVAPEPAVPANVRLERFVPHGPVLERAAAVVCHGGMGIVQKAMAAGVPIVAVPFGRDQPEVARRVAEAGLGVQLPVKQLTATRLAAAVQSAIAGRRGPRATVDTSANAARFADAAEDLPARAAARSTV